MSCWKKLTNLWRGNNKQSDVNGDVKSFWQTQKRTLPSDFLIQIARALLPDGGDSRSIMMQTYEDENPQVYWDIRDRSSIILDVIRRRPKACAPILASCLYHEGFDQTAIRNAVKLIAPHIILPQQLPPVDTEYRDAEIEYARNRNYENTIALANSISRHSIEAAIQIAEEGKNMSPRRLEALILLGRLYLTNKKPEGAAEMYNILVNDLKKEDFRAELANSLIECNKPNEAHIIIEQAKVQTPDLLFHKARAFKLQQKFNDAILTLKTIDIKNIRNPDRYAVEKGECEFELKQYLQSIKTVSEAKKREYMPALRITGMAMVKNENWMEAIPVLEKYLDKVSDDFIAWHALAESYYAVQNFPAALKAITEARQLAPKDKKIASLYAQTLVANKRYDEAAEFCSQSQETFLPPETTSVLLLETRQLQLASDYIRNWVEKQPRNLNAWMALGRLDELMNDYENAGMHYQQALNIKPDHMPALESIRRVMHKLEQ